MGDGKYIAEHTGTIQVTPVATDRDKAKEMLKQQEEKLNLGEPLAEFRVHMVPNEDGSLGVAVSAQFVEFMTPQIMELVGEALKRAADSMITELSKGKLH